MNDIDSSPDDFLTRYQWRS